MIASFASVSSSGVTRVSIIFLSSIITSCTAGAVTSVRTPVLTENGPPLRQNEELRLRAVGVAVLFAQIHVDAAGEHAAENRVHDAHRHVIGAVARHAERCDAQLRLRRARAIDDDQPRRRG